MENFKKVWGSTVTYVRPWKEEDTAETGEGVWLTGIPLHCWSKQTLYNIGSIWGRVMEIDMGQQFDKGSIHIDLKEEIRGKKEKLLMILEFEGREFRVNLSPMERIILEQEALDSNNTRASGEPVHDLRSSEKVGPAEKGRGAVTRNESNLVMTVHIP